MMRHAEDLAGERGADLMYRLHRAADRVALLRRIIEREAAARLHAVRADAVDRDTQAHDARRAGERRLDRGRIASRECEGLVAGVVGPSRRRFTLNRRLWRLRCSERFIFESELIEWLYNLGVCMYQLA